MQMSCERGPAPLCIFLSRHPSKGFSRHRQVAQPMDFLPQYQPRGIVGLMPSLFSRRRSQGLDKLGVLVIASVHSSEEFHRIRPDLKTQLVQFSCVAAWPLNGVQCVETLLVKFACERRAGEDLGKTSRVTPSVTRGNDGWTRSTRFLTSACLTSSDLP